MFRWGRLGFGVLEGGALPNEPLTSDPWALPDHGRAGLSLKVYRWLTSPNSKQRVRRDIRRCLQAGFFKEVER